MRRSGLWVGIAACAAFLLTLGLEAQTTAKKPGSAEASKIARGKYLVQILACTDCHTPKKMGLNGPEDDPTRFLAGHPEGAKVNPLPGLANTPWLAATTGDFTAWTGPWGVSYAMNLTPDENTGIGSWSEATFIGSIRNGKHMGVSRPVLPPMPWPAYRNLTDADLSAVYAYLRTIPRIQNRVPDPEPPPAAPAAPAPAR